MPSFGMSSIKVLDTCHPMLQTLFLEVVKEYDCQALVGARTVAEELQAIKDGRSKLSDPMQSKHVTGPDRKVSLAVDVAPYPVVWPSIKSMRLGEYIHTVGRFYHFAGYVLHVAHGLRLPVMWGGDWNGDMIFTDQQFDDLDHFELIT